MMLGKPISLKDMESVVSLNIYMLFTNRHCKFFLDIEELNIKCFQFLVPHAFSFAYINLFVYKFIRFYTSVMVKKKKKTLIYILPFVFMLT